MGLLDNFWKQQAPQAAVQAPPPPPLPPKAVFGGIMAAPPPPPVAQLPAAPPQAVFGGTPTTGAVQAPAPAPQAAPVQGGGGAGAGGVTNYLFKYADGSTGNSPWKKDANGAYLLNASGGILEEGVFQGRTMPDGTVNRSTIGNVAPNGMVHLYGGDWTTADNYNSAAKAPTGGAVFGGTPTGTAGAAPGTSGSGGTSAPGTSGSGGTSAPGDPLNRPVNAATETIEGRLGALLGRDAAGNYTNGVIRQAAEGAMAQFAGRGLLNSSMATEAATQAAMAKAIEIAGPDAQTYFSQGRANQDAQNVFKRDDLAFGREQITLDKQQGLEREKMTLAGSQFNQELAYKYEALKLDKASQAEATTLAHKHALEINSIKAVDEAFDLYTRRLAEIDNNKDLRADVKTQLKNSAGADFDLYAKAKGIVYSQQFGGRFEVAQGATGAQKQPGAGDQGSGGMLHNAVNR